MYVHPVATLWYSCVMRCTANVPCTAIMSCTAINVRIQLSVQLTLKVICACPQLKHRDSCGHGIQILSHSLNVHIILACREVLCNQLSHTGLLSVIGPASMAGDVILVGI